MKTFFIVMGALLYVGSPVAQTKFKPEWTVITEFTSESPDIPTDMTVDLDDNIIVIGDTGQKYVNGTWLQSDWFVAKFDPTGREIWRHVYDGGRNFEDIPQGVRTNQEGDVFVTGRSRRPGWSPPQYTTIRFRGSDGAVLWISNYRDQDYRVGANPHGLSIDTDGNVIVAGKSPPYDNDWATIKLSGQSGSLLWATTYDHLDLQDWVAGLAVDQIGNVYVSGSVYEDSPWLHSDLMFQKYSGLSGTTLWRTQWDSFGLLCKNGGGRIAFDDDGSLFMAGGGCAIVNGQVETSLWQLFKWNPDTGSIYWVSTDDSIRAVGSRLVLTIDGSPVIAGSYRWVDATGNEQTAWAAVKFHKDTGQILWRSSWFQTGNRERHDNRLQAIVSHPNGKLYGAGYLAGQVADAALMEIDPDTGAMRVLDVYYGSAQRGDGFTHMQALTDGNLVAVGTCTEQYSVGGNDLLIRKYIEVPLADVNGDLQVDDADLAFVLSVFGFYHPDADLNEDGRIDWADVQIALDWFGWSRR